MTTMPRYMHRQLAIADALLPHEAADMCGMPETELWSLVRARRFPLPSLICSTSRVARLPCWSRDEVEDWLRSRATRLQRPQ